MTKKKKIKRSDLELTISRALGEMDVTYPYGYDYEEQAAFLTNKIKENLGIEIEEDKKEPERGEVWEYKEHIVLTGVKTRSGSIELTIVDFGTQIGAIIGDFGTQIDTLLCVFEQNGKYLAPDLETYYRQKFEKEAKEQE